jgi:phosphoglycolate phosphatase
MNIRDYQNIIWDWNGTLLNDVWLCADIMNNLLNKRSLPEITLEKYREIFTFPVEDYYLKAGHSFENESFKVIGKEFMDEYELKKVECRLFPGAVNVLQSIRDLGIDQYLLSAYKQESLIDFVRQFGLDEYFLSVKGLNHIYADGKLKLARQLIAEISNKKNTSKTLFIGDTIHDFEVASNLGADCLIITSGHQSLNQLDPVDVTKFDSLEEFYAIL